MISLKNGLRCFILLASFMLLAGCSLIFYAVGAHKDNSKPDFSSVEGVQLLEIKPGSQLRIVTSAGDVLTGKFLGLYRAPEDSYKKEYDAFLRTDSSGSLLPEWGEPLSITMRLSGKRSVRKFAGFDAGGKIVLHGNGNSSTSSIYLNHISNISRKNGIAINIADVLKRLNSFNVPIISRVHLQSGTSADALIPFSDIQTVELKNSKNAKYTGLIAGAAVDAIVAAITISASSGPLVSTSSGNQQFSCPYFYSFDGKKYVLDSEPFGGALYRAAQRTDVDNLDYLREVKGTYRLRLTNELPETQYVDEVHLMVVDHSKNSRIVPEFSGAIHALRAIQSPVSAVDAMGNDALSLVKAKDQLFWTDNPLRFAASADLPDRSSLILEFPRPEKTSGAVLIFNVRNTRWASYLQGHILSLMGEELPDWYQFLNSVPRAREEIRQAFIREGMLNVQVWDGGRWKPAGYIWEVGPALPKDQALPIDISEISGKRLKIRIYATPGLWMVNSVGIAYEEDPNFQVTELQAESVIDQNGMDLHGLLKQEDHSYYTMDSNADAAELIFTAPPKRTDLARSVLLKTSGYYHIHVPSRGPDQLDFLNKLLTTPGEFSRYSVSLFGRKIRLALDAKWGMEHE